MKKLLSVIPIVCLLILSCRNDKSSIYLSIKEINELQLVDFCLTKTAILRDRYDEDINNDDSDEFKDELKKAFHWIEKNIKDGERIGVYEISKHYSVSIDLTLLSESDITINNDMISITFPDVKIQSLGDNFTPKVIHERHSLLRSPINIDERERTIRTASKKMDEEFASSSDLLYSDIKVKAKQKAKQYFTVILKEWGYKHIDIDFR